MTDQNPEPIRSHLRPGAARRRRILSYVGLLLLVLMVPVVVIGRLLAFNILGAVILALVGLQFATREFMLITYEPLITLDPAEGTILFCEAGDATKVSRFNLSELETVGYSRGHVSLTFKNGSRRITNDMTEFEKMREILIAASPRSAREFRWILEATLIGGLLAGGAVLWVYFTYVSP